jgi:hypothetical protein
MQRLLRISILIMVMCLILLTAPVGVRAIPPLPSSFYGTVKLNNANVPDGTQVEALIKDKVFAYSQTLTYQGDSVYALDIPGDDASTTEVEGGREGDTIFFKIGGILADQTGVWHSATNVNLNLTVTSTNTPLPPQATSTPLPTQTSIPVVPTKNPTTQPSETPKLPTSTIAAETQPAGNTPQDTQAAATDAASLSATVPTQEDSLAAETVTKTPLTPEIEEAGSSNPKTNLLFWIAIPAAILLVGLLLVLYVKQKK